MKRTTLAALAIVSVFVTGCGRDISTSTYQVSEAGVASKVLHGTVIAQRAVSIDTSDGVGALAGTAGGAVAGSAIGGSARTNIVGAIGGAVVGGLAGKAIDKAASTKTGMEYIIRLKDASTIAVTQVNDLNLRVGQKVLVIYGATTRVVPDETVQN